MKGEITKNGTLVIYRSGKERRMSCPFVSSEATCGDWCPLFAEPAGNDKGAFLELCHATLYFEEFEDERVEPEGTSHLSLAE